MRSKTLHGVTSDLLHVATVPGNQCAVHATYEGYHRPTPLRTVKHHIWPQEYGGPTVPENLVLVCDTGHYNIHAILAAYLADEDWPSVQRISKRERAIAQLGFERIQRQSL